ncbi:MAG TPA: hypothetical protein VHN14_21995, partial [Kofleriaceae bacterium]|nr:hypothetical protein [Kofleriaceae bacterium]
MTGSDAFDLWVGLSLVITGPAHVVFAALCVKRVRELASGLDTMPPSRICSTTVVVSCVPFVLLLGLPPMLVGLTLVPIRPLLDRMQPLVDRERGELALLPGRLPRV